MGLSQQASKADLDEIRQLIDQLEQKSAAVARKKSKRG
jgi:N-acetylglutamate synthase-like GNAT family acetyltransferase